MTLDLNALKKEARSKKTSPERLRELAGMDESLSRLIAKSKNTPPTLLQELARRGDMPTRRAVAANENTALDVLEQLAGDRQWTVLKALAKNPNTPIKTLETLAQHKRHSVRMEVAASTRCPADVLKTLAEDEHSDVRLEVLANPATSQSLFEAIAFYDPDEQVRVKAVRNPKVHASMWETFLNDSHWMVRVAVGVRHGFEPLKKDLPPILARLAQDPHERARIWVALRAEGEVLESFYQDPSALVRATALSNRNTPLDRAVALAKELDLNDPQVYKELKRRKDLAAHVPKQGS